MLTQWLNETLLIAGFSLTIGFVIFIIFYAIDHADGEASTVDYTDVERVKEDEPDVIKDSFANRLVVSFGEQIYHFDIPSNMGYDGFMKMLNDSVLGPVVEDLTGPEYTGTGIAVIALGDIATGMMGEDAARRIFSN